jgi:hypothetical protein
LHATSAATSNGHYLPQSFLEVSLSDLQDAAARFREHLIGSALERRGPSLGCSMMYWIYDYPSWVIGLLFCGTFVAFTWAGIFLTRVTVHSWLHRDKRANEMVGLALSSYFVLFGLLLGLVAVATYQNYANVGDIVTNEASSLSALYREVSSLPPPIRGELQQRLREYTRYTIEEGWAQQRKGIVPKGEAVRSGLLVRTLMDFEPSNQKEQIIYEEALRQSVRRNELSRQRLSNVTTGLPAVLWWVVAVGAAINIILIWLQDMEIHVHLILGAALACILGLVIFLIAELDNPFRGEVSIGPEAIVQVYENVMNPRQTGTPEQAMAMLTRAVAAVQADKTKALAMFNTGEGGFLDVDLYPYCFNVGDGMIVADVNQPKLVGQKVMDLKDATGKPFGQELYKAMQKPEREITDVSYMFPKPGSDRQLAPKVAFVTRVGDLGCAVGYYQSR